MFDDVAVLQANVLALVGWADGEFDEAEQNMLRDVLEATPTSDQLKEELFKLGQTRPQRDAVRDLVSRAPLPLTLAILRSAYNLAHVDGVLDAIELDLIMDLGRASGLNDSQLDTFQLLLERSHEAFKLEQKLLGGQS